MFKLPMMLAGALAESAEVRAKVILRKTLIVAVAGGLATGGFVFLLVAAHTALSRSLGPVSASTIIGAGMIGAAVAVFIYFRRNLEQPTPDAGSTVQAAAAVAADPSLLAEKASRTDSAIAQPLVGPPRATLSPAESAVHAAMTGNYTEAISHATTAGQQLGKKIPPAAIPVAGLAIGVVLAALLPKDDE